MEFLPQNNSNSIIITNQTFPKITCYRQNPRLFSQFAIIGFEFEFIYNELPYCYEEVNKSVMPSIISLIKPDPEEGVFDHELLINLAFGHSPPSWVHSEVEPQVYNHVFYIFNYFGFAYVIYENYSKFLSDSASNEQRSVLHNLWVPKAIVTLSLYPCFSTFHSMSQEIHLFFKDDRRYSSSRMKAKEYKGPTQQKLKESEKEPDTEDVFKSLKKEFDKVLEIELINIVNLLSAPLNNGYTFSFIRDKNLTVPSLSYYPLIDYNLCEIVGVLPVNLLIKTFFYAILEIDIFVFSENIQLLSLFNVSLFNFCYPLFENPQFERIACIGGDFLYFEDEHPLTKITQSPHQVILGVNSKLEKSNLNLIYELRKKDNNTYILDLDNKVSYFNLDTSDKQMKDLKTFFEKIFDNDNPQTNQPYSGNQLYQIKTALYNQIDPILKRAKEQSLVNFKPTLTFSASQSKKGFKAKEQATIQNIQFEDPSKLYVITTEVKTNNRALQEAFYECIIHIMSVLYKKYVVVRGSEKENLEEEIRDISTLLVDRVSVNAQAWKVNNDYYFWNLVEKQNMKFQNFFNEFLIGGKKPLVEKHVRIPYQFTEEFISLKSANLSFKNFGYFDIMDFFQHGGKSPALKETNFSFIDNTGFMFDLLMNKQSYYIANEETTHKRYITKSEAIFMFESKIIHEKVEKWINDSEKNDMMITHLNSDIFLSHIPNDQTGSGTKHSTANKIIPHRHNNSSSPFLQSNTKPTSHTSPLQLIKSHTGYIVDLSKNIQNEYLQYIAIWDYYIMITQVLLNPNTSKTMTQRYYNEELIDCVEGMLIKNGSVTYEVLLKQTFALVFVLTRKGLNMLVENLELNKFLEEFIENELKMPMLRKYLNLLMIYYNKNYLGSYLKCLERNNVRAENRNVFMQKIVNFIRKEDITPNLVMKHILSEISINLGEENSNLYDSEMMIAAQNYDPLIQHFFCCKAAGNLKNMMSLESNVYEDKFLKLSCQVCKKEKQIMIHMKIAESSYYTNVYSPVKLLNTGTRLLEEFFNNLRKAAKTNDSSKQASGLSPESMKELLDVIVNLLLYIQNLKISFSRGCFDLLFDSARRIKSKLK